MQSLSRSAITAARTGRTVLSRQTRRYAHEEHGHGHGHGADEPIGKGFWGTVALIPAGCALYALSRSDDPNAPPIFTRLINTYAETQEYWAARNDLHTRMIEQAGQDRILFNHSVPKEHVNMRFPEIMNNGSPYNVVAGSQANMDTVIAKFKKEAYEDNERKLEDLRNNNIKSEQPLVRLRGKKEE